MLVLHHVLESFSQLARLHQNGQPRVAAKLLPQLSDGPPGLFGPLGRAPSAVAQHLPYPALDHLHIVLPEDGPSDGIGIKGTSYRSHHVLRFLAQFVGAADAHPAPVAFPERLFKFALEAPLMSAHIALALGAPSQQILAHQHPRSSKEHLPTMGEAASHREFRSNQDDGVSSPLKHLQGTFLREGIQREHIPQALPRQSFGQGLFRIQKHHLWSHEFPQGLLDALGGPLPALRGLQEGAGLLLDSLEQDHLFGDDEPLLYLINEPGFLEDSVNLALKVSDIEGGAEIAHQHILPGSTGGLVGGERV